MFKKLLLILLMTFALLFVGCDKDDDGDGDTNTNIPADPVNVTPPTPTKNNVQPTASFSAQGERVQLNVQGLVDPTTQQPITLYYNSENPASSNIFVQQNGVTKGLLVTKVGSGTTTLKADVVFTVDNSGSMGEEADVVAAGIVNFANALASSGLDVQFGCVGYDSYANGAINLTTAANLSTHLNRSGYTGTSRTYGFSGSDASTLETNASNFGYAGGENGVLATLFAYQHFAWRSGASKVFINFTDEPTQPAYSDLSFNTAELCNTIGGVATVHTVFSEDTSYYSNYNYWSEYNERPWKMSECTGGTVKFVDPYATNLVLTDLPVVGALSNSYLVEYMKGSSAVQSWLVTITVYTSTADGSTTYNATY